MRFEVVTLLPEMFSPLNYGVVGRARENTLWDVNYWNPRDYATDVHNTVDDRPFGGGPGMVLKVEPLLTTIKAAKESAAKVTAKAPVILLSPQGEKVTQQKVADLAELDAAVLVSGRYEGIDERVIELAIDEQWSIGDYVISGGELAAMVVIDATVRLLPGVLGHEESAKEDSFSCGLLDCPHYTRPQEIYGRRVPEVLLSGDHARIAAWRQEQRYQRTLASRQDLETGDLT